MSKSGPVPGQLYHIATVGPIKKWDWYWSSDTRASMMKAPKVCG